MEEGVTRWIAAHPRSPLRPNGMDGNRGGARRPFGSFSRRPTPSTPVGRGNSLVPTGAGTLRPTYLLPVTMTAGAGMSAADTLIVGLKGFKDFQGDTVSLHLQCRGVNLSLPRYGLEGLTALALARLMDETALPGESRRGDPAPDGRGEAASAFPPSWASGLPRMC